jgi:hypothetical protein
LWHRLPGAAGRHAPPPRGVATRRRGSNFFRAPLRVRYAHAGAPTPAPLRTRYRSARATRTSPRSRPPAPRRATSTRRPGCAPARPPPHASSAAGRRVEEATRPTEDLIARVALAARTGGEACRLPAQRRPCGEAHTTLSPSASSTGKSPRGTSRASGSHESAKSMIIGSAARRTPRDPTYNSRTLRSGRRA